MALTVPKKKKIVKIVIIIAGRIQAALDEDPPVEHDLFETVNLQLSEAACKLWDTDEGSWGIEEQAVWAAFEELHDEAESEPIDEGKLSDLSDSFGAALDIL